MTKYYEGVLYKGNIVKNNNGEREVRKGVYIIYSKFNDCFYGYEVLNELLDIELNHKLSIEDRQEKLKKIKEYTYTYSDVDIELDNQTYIDENTIIAVTPSNIYNRAEAKNR